MKYLQTPISALRLLTESRPFTNYVIYGLLLLMFSFVGGALVELILPLDTTKYLYRAVVIIPGLILLPVLLAQKKFHVFLLPACYLLYGTISACWSYPQGYQQLGTALELSLYTLSFIAVILFAFKHFDLLEKRFFLLLNCITLAIFLDIAHYAFFQEGSRLHGSLGSLNPNIIALFYGLCALLAFNQIIRRKALFNFKGFMLLFVAFTAITALLLTNSRACTLSLVLALLILCLMQRQAKVCLLTLGIFLASVFTSLGINVLKFEESKFSAPAQHMLSRQVARVNIWQALIGNMQPKEYIYGRGLLAKETQASSHGEDPINYHPHSLIISSFYYFGIIGACIHLLMYFQILRQSYQDLINGHFLLPGIVGLSLIPFFFDGVSIHSYLSVLAPHMLVFWFIYALSCIKRISQTNH